jgi:ubiquinone biosynthesis accessory factor UbiJ
MFSTVAAAAINHLLRREDWARERLLPFAGRIARLAVPPTAVTLAVTATGEVAAADNVQPDVTLTVAAGSLLDVLRDPQAASTKTQVTGDGDFAEAISYLFTHLRWDVEEDLSKVVGDVAAHRIASFGRDVAHLPGRVVESVSRSVSAYLQEERGAVPSRSEVEVFNHAVNILRDDTARLEKRLERLQPSRDAEGD